MRPPRPIPTRWVAGGMGSHDWQPFIDGRPATLCIEAYSGADGWIRHYRTNDAGDVDQNDFGKPIVETTRGHVEIRPCSY